MSEKRQRTVTLNADVYSRFEAAAGAQGETVAAWLVRAGESQRRRESAQAFAAFTATAEMAQERAQWQALLAPVRETRQHAVEGDAVLKQGEILRAGGSVFVVLTDDRFGAVAPVVAPMIRARGFGGELAVATAEDDHITGTIMVPWAESVPPAFGDEVAGIVSVATMAAIGRALQLMFGV